jgi:AraC-like DNA-binding protein
MARIFRFERAMQGLAAGRFATLADLASDCGYADQAHFNRDFAQFAGETPRSLMTRILPDGTGVMAAGR